MLTAVLCRLCGGEGMVEDEIDLPDGGSYVQTASCPACLGSGVLEIAV